MGQLIIDIKNESIMDRILWMLEHFKDDGIEIKTSIQKETEMFSDEYIEKNWREIGMGTHSANLDDNDRKYEAYAEFYDDKCSS